MHSASPQKRQSFQQKRLTSRRDVSLVTAGLKGGLGLLRQGGEGGGVVDGDLILLTYLNQEVKFNVAFK